MPLRYRPKLHLTEREIRYAMAHSTNNTEAAAFLGIHFNTYKMYASLYVDEATQKTLYQLHKRQGNRSKRPHNKVKSKYEGLDGLMDILSGKFPHYKGGKRFMQRLLDEGIFAPMCSCCGFNEQRITDHTVPLILDYLDGNRSNHHKDNLRLLCFNCYYLQVGDLPSLRSSFKTKSDEGPGVLAELRSEPHRLEDQAGS